MRNKLLLLFLPVLCGPAVSLAAANDGHLTVPELIQVLSIDGQEVAGGFLGARARTLDLPPGEHVLSVRYTQLFRLGADDHDIIRSTPVALRHVIAAGKTYELQVKPPVRYEAAREFAKNPVITLRDPDSTDVQQGVVVRSYAEASLLDSIGKALQGQPEAGSTTAPMSTSTSTDNLRLLQDIWSRASAAERQAFAAWMVSQSAKP